MTMLSHAPNQLYCTHCQFSYPGGPEFVRHPEYKNLATWLPSHTVLNDFEFLTRVKTCPNQGLKFGFPEAIQIMDKNGR